MEKRIGEYLLRLGFVSNIKGCVYIREALRILVAKNRLCNLKSEVYPIIAQKYSTTIHNVEKNISNAIDRAFLQADMDEIYAEFTEVDEARARPTVKEFLAHATARLTESI